MSNAEREKRRADQWIASIKFFNRYGVLFIPWMPLLIAWDDAVRALLGVPA